MGKIIFNNTTKEYFRKQAKKVHCKWYDPCPLCYKCKVKASHLFAKCARCKIPICSHSDKQRKMMLIRENFEYKGVEELIEE